MLAAKMLGTIADRLFARACAKLRINFKAARAAPMLILAIETLTRRQLL